jgi:hypothetical protein
MAAGKANTAISDASWRTAGNFKPESHHGNLDSGGWEDAAEELK